ncbi:MAG: transposase, partial [Nitrospirales bacterium]|nr:transposase [Nitrospirales bacterium]
MKRSRFSEEQIVYAIRQAESGTPISDLCRQLGVSDATFYIWKKKYAHLGVSELRRLRQVARNQAHETGGLQAAAPRSDRLPIRAKPPGRSFDPVVRCIVHDGEAALDGVVIPSGDLQCRQLLG